MPGNGPCPALGPTGCLLKQYRPITCTTQLCEKMLTVLGKLDIIKMSKHAPLQIEDIVPLPDILQFLYGSREGRKIKPEEVKEYFEKIKTLKTKFAKTNQETRKEVINETIIFFMDKGGKI